RSDAGLPRRPRRLRESLSRHRANARPHRTHPRRLARGPAADGADARAGRARARASRLTDPSRGMPGLDLHGIGARARERFLRELAQRPALRTLVYTFDMPLAGDGWHTRERE